MTPFCFALTFLESGQCPKYVAYFGHFDFDLASAHGGSWAIEPSVWMLERLQVDYAKTVPMIFGTAPKFEEIMASTKKINDSANQ